MKIKREKQVDAVLIRDLVSGDVFEESTGKIYMVIGNLDETGRQDIMDLENGDIETWDMYTKVYPVNATLVIE